MYIWNASSSVDSRTGRSFVSIVKLLLALSTILTVCGHSGSGCWASSTCWSVDRRSLLATARSKTSGTYRYGLYVTPYWFLRSSSSESSFQFPFWVILWSNIPTIAISFFNVSLPLDGSHTHGVRRKSKTLRDEVSSGHVYRWLPSLSVSAWERRGLFWR